MTPIEFELTPWMEDAACRDTDLDVFFPDDTRLIGSAVKSAKAICGVCPVAAECLAYAQTNGIMYGIWGGLVWRERRMAFTGSPHSVRVAEQARSDQARALKASGWTVDAIAARLRLSTRTVQRYLTEKRQP